MMKTEEQSDQDVNDEFPRKLSVPSTHAQSPEVTHTIILYRYRYIIQSLTKTTTTSM